MLVRAQVAALSERERRRLEPALRAIAQAVGFDQQLAYSQQNAIAEAAYAEFGKRHQEKETNDIPVMVCSPASGGKVELSLENAFKKARRTSSSIKVGRGEHADLQLPDGWNSVYPVKNGDLLGQFNLVPLENNRIQVFGGKGDHPTFLIPANEQRIPQLQQHGYEPITFRDGKQAIKLKPDPDQRLQVFSGDSIMIFAGSQLGNVDIKLDIPKPKPATTSI